MQFLGIQIPKSLSPGSKLCSSRYLNHYLPSKLCSSRYLNHYLPALIYQNPNLKLIFISIKILINYFNSILNGIYIGPESSFKYFYEVIKTYFLEAKDLKSKEKLLNRNNSLIISKELIFKSRSKFYSMKVMV